MCIRGCELPDAPSHLWWKDDRTELEEQRAISPLQLERKTSLLFRVSPPSRNSAGLRGRAAPSSNSLAHRLQQFYLSTGPDGVGAKLERPGAQSRHHHKREG